MQKDRGQELSLGSLSRRNAEELEARVTKHQWFSAVCWGTPRYSLICGKQCREGHLYFSVCALTLGPVYLHETASKNVEVSPGRQIAHDSVTRAGLVNLSYEEMDGTVDFLSHSVSHST